MHGVAGDREARAGDVVLAQVRQRLLNSLRHSGLAARDALPASPVCQTLRNQTQSKPISARRSSSASGMSSSVAAPAQGARQLRQPDAGVDLVERRDNAACPWLTPASPADAQPARLRLASAVTCRTRRPCRPESIVSASMRREEMHEPGDEAGPAGLVAGAQAGAVVAVEVLVEQDVDRASADRPGTSACRRRPAGGRCASRRKMRVSRRGSPRPPRTGSSCCRSRSGTRP